VGRRKEGRTFEERRKIVLFRAEKKEVDRLPSLCARNGRPGKGLKKEDPCGARRARTPLEMHEQAREGKNAKQKGKRGLKA